MRRLIMLVGCALILSACDQDAISTTNTDPPPTPVSDAADAPDCTDLPGATICFVPYNNLRGCMVVIGDIAEQGFASAYAIPRHVAIACP